MHLIPNSKWSRLIPQKKHDFRSIKCLRNSKLITLIREVKPYTVFEPTEVVNSKTKKLRISRTFLSLKLNLHFQRFIIYRSWYRPNVLIPLSDWVNLTDDHVHPCHHHQTGGRDWKCQKSNRKYHFNATNYGVVERICISGWGLLVWA